ncbi:hypothetical protein [Caminibacter mediatlanticus]|uniref:Uncharacterized protein n=1 Tax=Caminibacter mediatlanticus TB-2 TaxID=391592 RepID=A0AAI9F1P2_9BACT|nr:hypothetical protein [Caminibacter mediatlanticus]EDM22954.1 hypothetical protein CMTB2_05597 [Caminibacter mediatlanticus TB-2]
MKYDYVNYIYIRIPINEYKKYEKHKDCIPFHKIREWRFDYDLKQKTKKEGIKIAQLSKKEKAERKILDFLENYYGGLLKEDNIISISKLAKKSGVHYNTAKKFAEKYNLERWIEYLINNKATWEEFLEFYNSQKKILKK